MKLYAVWGMSVRANERHDANFVRQALHCVEDFSAHSNYTELALRELGYHNVFPHCGTATEITVRGKRIYPITTGTFGGLDFVLSVM
jgi:hypothetical protein